jgi:hypothetical protein
MCTCGTPRAHATPLDVQKYPSIMSLEEPPSAFPVGAMRVFDSGLFCCRLTFCFPLLLSLLPWKLQLGLLGCYFNFNPYFFYFFF